MVGLLGDLCGLLLCLEEFAKFFSADLFYIEFYSIFDSVLYLSLCSTVYQLSARFFRFVSSSQGVRQERCSYRIGQIVDE